VIIPHGEEKGKYTDREEDKNDIYIKKKTHKADVKRKTALHVGSNYVRRNTQHFDKEHKREARNLDVKDFFSKLKQHCTDKHEKNGKCNCERCRYRKFCYTPPINMAESLIAQTLQNLKNTTGRNENGKQNYEHNHRID